MDSAIAVCGRVTRELVPSSLQVYLMKGYGAVEMGVHRFHHPGHDDTEPVGEGKFIHLWQYKDGAWKITRVISYDHHAMASEANRLILQRPDRPINVEDRNYQQSGSGSLRGLSRTVVRSPKDSLQ